MSRGSELGAQYATVEEILEQPSPLPQRLQCVGTLLGLLAVDSDQPAPFLPDDELFLENLGDLIAVRLSLAAPPSRP